MHNLLNLILLGALLTPSWPKAADPPPGHDHAAIRQAVEQFLGAEASGRFPGEISVEVNGLDPRLRLKACPEALEVGLNPGSDALGKTTVLVKCPVTGGWSLYVPAQVTVMGEVLVAARYIARGDLLGPGDAELERRDLSRLRYGYLTDPAQLAGTLAKRAIREGMVVLPQAIETAPLVRRKDQVTILARGGGLEVQAHGIALQDGTKGERIRVRNLGSKREIEAVIIGAGIVEVTF
jgi:flagella basal body P-ring formation protein FlgA